MKYKIWDRINKCYIVNNTNLFVHQNGKVYHYNYEAIENHYIIQRCTDLLDMNNNEIYEGDICEYYRGQHEFKTGIANEIGIIRYHKGQFIFDNELKESPINEYVKIDSNLTYLKIIDNEVNV